MYTIVLPIQSSLFYANVPTFHSTNHNTYLPPIVTTDFIPIGKPNRTTNY
jgi:hypothetical protein